MSPPRFMIWFCPDLLRMGLLIRSSRRRFSNSCLKCRGSKNQQWPRKSMILLRLEKFAPISRRESGSLRLSEAGKEAFYNLPSRFLSSHAGNFQIVEVVLEKLGDSPLIRVEMLPKSKNHRQTG